MPTLHVHLSPALLAPEDCRGGTAVVIDLIRASTTIVWALGNGAASVVPCESVEEALRTAETTPGCLLGGERGGILIDGFDLGNSPSEYSPERIGGRAITFTTTNGTRAIKRTLLADRTLVGAFANFSSTVAAASESLRAGRPVHLVCAGIHDQPCLEDTLCAGAMAQALHSGFPELPVSDSGCIAIAAWLQHSVSRVSLQCALRASQGGQKLISVGLDADLAAVAEWDRHFILAEHRADGAITTVPRQPECRWRSPG